MAHKDVISKMGSIWKTLSSEEKTLYEKKAKEKILIKLQEDVIKLK